MYYFNTDYRNSQLSADIGFGLLLLLIIAAENTIFLLTLLYFLFF